MPRATFAQEVLEAGTRGRGGVRLFIRRGRKTSVGRRNELPAPTVVHLHGGVSHPGTTVAR